MIILDIFKCVIWGQQISCDCFYWLSRAYHILIMWMDLFVKCFPFCGKRPWAWKDMHYLVCADMYKIFIDQSSEEINTGAERSQTSIYVRTHRVTVLCYLLKWWQFQLRTHIYRIKNSCFIEIMTVLIWESVRVSPFPLPHIRLHRFRISTLYDKSS